MADVEVRWEQEIARAREAVGDAFQPRAKNLGQLLAANARETPTAPALLYVDDDRQQQRDYTWASLYDRVAETAGFLKQEGVQHGDRIAFLIGNLDYTLILYLAAFSLGASVAPINATEDEGRKNFIAKNSGASLLFVREDYEEEGRQLAQNNDLRLIIVTNSPTESDTDADGTRYYPALLRSELRNEPSTASFEAKNTEALLIYTSGTTGAPKGVRVDQHNIMANAAGMATHHGWDASLRMMCVLPVHHVNGIVVTLSTPLYVGGSLVLTNRFNSRTFWGHIHDHRVRVVSVVPTLLEFLTSAHERSDGERAFDRTPPVALETIVCGAGPLLVETALSFERAFGIRITHGYGLSETSCYNCHMPVDLDTQTRQQWYERHGFPSIGTPLPYQEMAVLGADGKPLPPLQRGELAVRGECVSLGYDQRPDANAESFQHGWFRSGDEGFYDLDADGRPFFFITGRLKELIIRGGVNYSPLEIDEVLNLYPGVASALCLPFANRFYGEEIAAYVVPEDGVDLDADAILAFCRERLEFSKSPKVVLFGHDVPYTSTGKPRRIELARQLADALAPYKDTQFQKRG